MSTRSIIAREYADGKIRSIYCHWDGYPSHNGQILREHYTDENKIEQLLALAERRGVKMKTTIPNVRMAKIASGLRAWSAGVAEWDQFAKMDLTAKGRRIAETEMYDGVSAENAFAIMTRSVDAGY